MFRDFSENAKTRFIKYIDGVTDDTVWSQIEETTSNLGGVCSFG